MTWSLFVKDANKLWSAWNQAKAYKTTPSALYGITEYPMAFWFDRAVWAFGSRLEEEIEQARSKAKTETRQRLAVNMVYHRWLSGR